MVSTGRRGWRSREEVPQEFRECRSLERSIWGASRLLSNECWRLASEVFTEIFGACVQEDRLWIADPKAINHVLQKSCRLYVKARGAQERTALVAGRGVFWAQGEFCYHD